MQEKSGAAKPEEKPPDPFFKRNAFWIIPSVMMLLTLGLGSGFFAWLFGTVIDRRIDDRVADIRKGVHDNTAAIANLTGKVDTLLRWMESSFAGKMKAAAEKPRDRSTQATVKEAIAEARSVGAKMPISLITDTGRAFVAVSNENQGAWEVATEVASYRTTLNEPSPLEDRKPTPHENQVLTSMAGPVDPSGLRIIQLGTVQAGQAAKYEEIGQNRNAGRATLTALLIVDHQAPNAGFELDGFHIRNVVFRNAVIYYKGGSVILENVIFLNCRFVLANTDSTRQLGGQLITESKIDFKREKV